jgi:hypothetical protein
MAPFFDCLSKISNISPTRLLPCKPMISGVTCDLVGFMTSNNYTHCQESTTHDQMAGFSYIGDYDSVVEASSIQLEKIFISNSP